ncbi:MAG: IS5/IS1182 family transposase [Candidatus Cloacimonetes bacterium 4572_65]|nr:MAG: IS5/IS1182 family transposase [Candidatus Cloacimonetes bacterium 4572_65]
MFTKRTAQQHEFEFVNIENLVPEEHLLRGIDETINFDFIYDKVKHLYSTKTGRPSIDSVVLFKMVLIQYLFGISSERKLIRQIKVNMAFRWFLGYKLTDKIPHHSVFSQNRRRRFTDSTIFKDIFETIVEQAIELGFIEGKVLYTDSTHIKASANKNKFDKITVEKKPSVFIDELNEDVTKEREDHDKKPFKQTEPKVETKITKQSRTDPDSGYMCRNKKPLGFFYLDHRTVDGQYNFITDVFITPGNVNDSVPYLSRLDYQTKRFNFNVEAVGIDAGYNTAAICKGIVERNIIGVIGYRRSSGKKGFYKKYRFRYNAEEDTFTCLADCILSYKTTSRNGYSSYASDVDDCCNCSLRGKCITAKSGIKTITRHVWEDYKDIIKQNKKEDYGKEIYKRRQETVERSFANAKQLHGYRYARLIGLEKVKFQAYMTATAQNVKKIAKLLKKRMINRGLLNIVDKAHHEANIKGNLQPIF